MFQMLCRGNKFRTKNYRYETKLVSNLASHESFSWRLDIIEIEQSAKFIL